MKDKKFSSIFATGLMAGLLLTGTAYALNPQPEPPGSEIKKEDSVSIKMSGEFRTRGFYTSDLVSPGLPNSEDTEAFGDLRFRLKTTVKSDVAMGVIVADFTNGFCAPSVATVQSGLPLDQGMGSATFDDVLGFCSPGTVSTGNARFGTGTAFGHSLNIVGIREAYLMVHLKNFGAVAGRKHYRLGHGLVLDDTATGVGARAHLGPVTLTVADLNLADPIAGFGSGFAGTNNDSALYLIKLTDAPKAGMGHGKEKYSIYLGQLKDPKGNLTYNGFGGQNTFVAGFNAELNFIGASLKQYTYREGGPIIDLEVNSFDGDIEGAGAADPNISGISALASLSVSPKPGKTVGLTFVYGSGQDPSKNPATGGKLNINALSGNYSLGNILLNTSMNSDRDGSSLTVGTRGIMAVKLSADCVKDEKKSLGVAVIWAETAEDTTFTSRNLGVELDGNASIKLDNNLQLTAGIGYLFAGNAWKEFKGDDGDAIKLHTAVVLTF